MFTSLAFALATLAVQVPQMPAGTPLDWVNRQSLWKQAGSATMAKAPPEVRAGDGYTKLKFLYGKYCDLIVQSGAPLNSTRTGRYVHGQDAWTCGGHAFQLEGFFNGAGIKDLKIGFIKGQITDTWEATKAGVNSEHGALFATVEGMPFAFDPWLPAYITNGTYRNDLQADFGGLPFQIWEVVTRRYGYARFTGYEPEGQEPPWRTEVERALSDVGMVKEKFPDPPKPERPVVGGHWRLDRLSVVKADWMSSTKTLRAFAAFKGQLWSWNYEGADKVLVRTSVRIQVSPSLAFLTPGTVNVIARIQESRPQDSGKPTTWCDFMWAPMSGVEKHYVGVDRVGYLSPEQAGPYADVMDVNVPVPAGPGKDDFRLIFSCGGTTADGGGVHYIYKWSDQGSVPEQIAKATFDGRWQTEWGVVELKVKDRDLKGTYPHDSGRLEGKVSLDGMTVTGTWKEAPSFAPPKDAGEFEFTLSENGKTFDGHYWYGKRKPGDKGAAWKGKRIT